MIPHDIIENAQKHLPSSERDHVMNFFEQLRQLNYRIRNFSDAVELIEYCRSARLKRHWITIAARDATMTVFHIGKILDKSFGMRACPVFRKHIDNRKLKSLRAEFKKYFPDWDEARHAIAHSGEYALTAEKRKEHSMSGSFSLPRIDVRNCTGITFRDAVVASEEEVRIFNTAKPNHSDAKNIESRCDKTSLIKLKELSDHIAKVLHNACESLAAKD